MANGQHRPHQRGLVLLGRSFREFAELERQAVNLQELGEIAHRVVLPDKRPDEGAHQPRAGHVTGFGFGPVHHPAQRIEGHPFIAAITQAQGLRIIRQHLENRRVTPLAALGHQQPIHVLPTGELLRRKTLEQRIRSIKDGIGQPVKAAQQLLDKLAVGLLGGAGIVRGLQCPGHRQPGAAPLAKLTEQVRVFLLHVLGQLALGDQVAALGVSEQLRRPIGGDTHARVLALLAHDHPNLGSTLGLDLVRARRCDGLAAVALYPTRVM